jgi:hypothetical protein
MNNAVRKWLLRIAQWYGQKGLNRYEQAEALYKVWTEA